MTKNKRDIIVDDYIGCASKNLCDECAAHEKVQGTNVSFCSLLSHYRSKLKDAINETIEKN
jgi:hypothetical protein